MFQGPLKKFNKLVRVSGFRERIIVNKKTKMAPSVEISRNNNHLKDRKQSIKSDIELPLCETERMIINEKIKSELEERSRTYRAKRAFGKFYFLIIKQVNL